MIRDWNQQREAGWPEIQLAINYPLTPEMYGVTEAGWEGPTFFMWRTDSHVIVTPFSGDYVAKYYSMRTALEALAAWAKAVLAGERPPIGADEIVGTVERR